MGRGAALAVTLPMINTISSCAGIKINASEYILKPLQPSLEDELLLTEGFNYEVLIKWGDIINSSGAKFGFNNDYIAFIPFEYNPLEGLLWVNHEYPDPVFLSQYKRGTAKTKEQVINELNSVGGSILHIKKGTAGKWQVLQDDQYNRRITGLTPIPIISDRIIENSAIATGTFGNCAGGVTPWGTILTCEENTEGYYGEVGYTSSGERIPPKGFSYYGYNQYFNYPPEHYGWVVEVNTYTGEAKKLTSMGRFAHECATVRLAANGTPVVYTGDDAENEHLYKFISDKKDSLEKGKLYVADFQNKKWQSLMIEEQPVLQKYFKDQTEILIRTREAAKLVGATPLDRPEDIEIDPLTGAIIVSATNNYTTGNFYGSLLRLMETNNDPLSMTFEPDKFLSGGPETGFACPDNLAFDKNGNLWLTTDISGLKINTEQYKAFKNNGLFYIPMSGENAGIPIQIASAPVQAELTGPYFAPDNESMFLSVQHPGELTLDIEHPTSNWPDGGNAMPKPSVVVITGEMMKDLLS